MSQATEEVIRKLGAVVRAELEKSGPEMVAFIKDELKVPVEYQLLTNYRRRTSNPKHPFRSAVNIRRSAPGEPPRKETGRLQASIQHEVTDRGGGTFSLRIFSEVPYAKLEYGIGQIKPRPYLAPAVKKFKPIIEERIRSHAQGASLNWT